MWFTDRRSSSTNTPGADARARVDAYRRAGDRGDDGVGRSFVAHAGIALAALLLVSPQMAQAADPAPTAEAPATPTVSAVTPAEFAAGASVTITGSNFAEGDTVLLDSLALTDLEITPTSITGTVPGKAKLGKKLIVKRGKKKVAELLASAGFTFVPAPKLTSVTPKFAAPGETVTVKGKGLFKVSELTLAGAKVAIAEQSDTAIKFVAIEGSKTGPLVVKSLGGAAALKKDYEVFYAPTLASAEPPAAFEGDAVTLKGAHLAAPVKFKLGSKALKASAQADGEATLTLAKGSKTGPLKATARGKSASLAADFTVHPTPLLTTVPKEVGAPGELKISGKNLDVVSTWRLGQVALTAASAGKSKAVLTIPADAPTDQPLIAVTQGREFASKQPVATVKTPIVRGLAFWTGPGGKGVEGVVRGADFSSKTKFTLAGKPLKTTFVAADRVRFTAAKAPPASAQKLTAKAGKYSGAPLEVNGAGAGYRVPADQLSAQLAALPPKDYDLVAAQLDLEVSEHLAGEAEAAAQQNADSARVAALGLRVAQDLQRVAVAQAAVCSGMTAGKDKLPVAANAAAGELLRQSSRHAQTLLTALEKLWSTLGPDALATAGLGEVDAAIASVGAAQPKVQAACKGRFHGSGQLVSEATTTVKLDLDRLYKPPIVAAFEDVLARGKTWNAVEKDVGDRLTQLPAARRKLWTDVLKGSKTAVAAATTNTTGKGATGDKHVEKQGKPTGSSPGTGKGGKGKAN